jgi:hypothetical protein
LFREATSEWVNAEIVAANRTVHAATLCALFRGNKYDGDVGRDSFECDGSGRLAASARLWSVRMKARMMEMRDACLDCGGCRHIPAVPKHVGQETWRNLVPAEVERAMRGGGDDEARKDPASGSVPLLYHYGGSEARSGGESEAGSEGTRGGKLMEEELRDPSLRRLIKVLQSFSTDTVLRRAGSEAESEPSGAAAKGAPAAAKAAAAAAVGHRLSEQLVGVAVTRGMQTQPIPIKGGSEAEQSS